MKQNVHVLVPYFAIRYSASEFQIVHLVFWESFEAKHLILF